MNRFQDLGQDSAGLALLGRLATPLWLLGMKGAAIWLNDAARAVLQVRPESVPATVVAAISDDVLGALGTVAPGTRVSGSITFRSDDAETIVACHLSKVSGLIRDPRGLGVILAEAVTDPVVRREVLRLNEQLASVLDAFPDLRFVLRGDGTVLDVTALKPADLGLSLERVLDRRIQDIVPFAARDHFVAALNLLAGGQAVVAFQYSLPIQDGPGYFDARLIALPDGLRTMLVIRNITKRTRAELAASITQQRLLDVTAAMAEGIALFDSSERLIFSNRRYQALLPLSADLLSPGQKIAQILLEAARRGQYAAAEGRIESWLAERMAWHRSPSPGGFEEILGDGRRLRVTVQRTTEGGVVSFVNDRAA